MSLFGTLKKQSKGRDEFAAMLINYLKDIKEPRFIEYRRENFSLTLGEDMVALESYYQKFLAADADRHDRTMYEIYQALQPPKPIKDYQEVKHLLMPVLRSQMQANNRALQFKASKINAGREVLLQLAGDLRTGIVIDNPQMMQYVVEENILKWGLKTEQVKNDALNNLAKESKPDFEEVEKGIFRSAWADGFDASRLLIPGLFKGLGIEKDILAMASNADSVWVTDGSKPENVAALIKKAAPALLQEGRPLTPDLFVLKNNYWQLFTLNADHPAYGMQEELFKLWMDDIYAQQQQTLRQIYQDENNDPFIATYTVSQKAGRVVTYCAWTQGITIPFWLPKTDLIVFVPEDGESFPIPWARVEAALGKLPVVKSIDAPLRYEVEDFPSEEQFKAMTE